MLQVLDVSGDLEAAYVCMYISRLCWFGIGIDYATSFKGIVQKTGSKSAFIFPMTAVTKLR